MKISLRLIGLAGFILFTFFFTLTFHVPGFVEDVGKEFIKQELQERTKEKIDSLSEIDLSASDSRLLKFADKLLKQNQDEISRLQEDLNNNLHVKLADIIAEMRNLDCECRIKYDNWFKKGYESRIVSLEKINEKLLDFMRGKYMEIATELKQDFRIFTGSNAFIFLLLLLVSFLKPHAIKHLFLPGILLVISSVVIAYFYIFEQNWLINIIYSDLWGFTYLGYVGILFLFLCDIVFNRARITTEIINALLQAIGSATSVLPC